MRSEQIPNHDPFTIEIIQNSLHAICDEMFAATRKTAMSSIIYEVQDLGVGVMDADGNLTTQGAGLPIFIGMLDASARQVLKKFGPSDEIFPGDVYITNDPYSGGVSHLNDVVLVMPVFADDRLIGWTANKAHWSDIGGMVHGSISTDADEVFQEGLQLPDIKLIERGRPIQSVFDLITANVRVPDYALGDLWAAIASIRAGERRLVEMAQKYGLGAVEHAMAQLLDYGEKVSRRAVSALPDGVYTAEDRTDDGLTMRVKVTIRDGDFIVDLRDNPDRVAGPYNCPYACTVVGARILFKALTGPHSVTNEGCFRPLTVLTDKGSMFDVERPVAVGMYFDPMMYTIDLIWKAMAPIAPERLGAGPPAIRTCRHLRHESSGHGKVHRHDRAGGRRMGSGAGPRRRERPVLCRWRRNVQLPDRNQRSPQRPVRRSIRLSHASWRRGGVSRRPGRRPGLPHPRRRHASDRPLRAHQRQSALRSERRPRRLAQSPLDPASRRHGGDA